MHTWWVKHTHAVNLRLDGIQSCHVHLEQPILPVDSGDPAVVDTSWYVTERLPIFPKAVVLVIHAEWTRCPELHVNTSHHDSQLNLQVQIWHWSWSLDSYVGFDCVPSRGCGCVFQGTALTPQLTRMCHSDKLTFTFYLGIMLHVPSNPYNVMFFHRPEWYFRPYKLQACTRTHTHWRVWVLDVKTSM